MRLPSIFLLLFAVLVTATAFAAPPEVDKAAVIRLGDMVQHVDGIQADGDDLYVQAMATPADDRDKWFISILTMQNCPPCDKLKADWRSSEWLKALADPNDQKRSWAHYSVYAREDRSQSFRFQNLQVAGYPTVIVQPPLSGKYGDPSTVVFQSTYGGDPERLARQITDAVRRYVNAMGPRSDGVHQSQSGARYEPPWSPSPQPNGPGPNCPSPYYQPQNQPLSFPDGLPMIPPPSPVVTGSVVQYLAIPLIVVSAALIGMTVPSLARHLRESRERRIEKELASEIERKALLQAIQEMKTANASSTVQGSRTSGAA